MSWVDPLILLWVALAALVGYQRGLSAQLVSLLGLALGAFAGSRLAPFFLADGQSSPWVPFASLIGAAVGAILFQTGANVLGKRIRALLMHGPLRIADSVGGVAVGAALGLAVAWLAAVAALQVQGSSLRRTVQESSILSGIVDAVPPRDVLRTLGQFDALPQIAAPPDLRLPPPDGSVQESPMTRAVAAGVVKVQSIACGTGSQGSGWVVGQGIVVTNAHVIAGAELTQVGAVNGQVFSAVVVYVDAGDDVALLLVPDLLAPSLETATEPPDNDEVALLGYPRDGPLTATAGTAGLPIKVFAPDAYGESPRLRTVVPLRGKVERGDSGGPAVNADGEVVAMMFAATKGGGGGFGVPVEAVLRAFDSPLEPVSTGRCDD